MGARTGAGSLRFEAADFVPGFVGLGERTGFHRTYIGMVERGERNISLSNIGVFAKFFEMTLSQLFDFSEVDES